MQDPGIAKKCNQGQQTTPPHHHTTTPPTYPIGKFQHRQYLFVFHLNLFFERLKHLRRPVKKRLASGRPSGPILGPVRPEFKLSRREPAGGPDLPS